MDLPITLKFFHKLELYQELKNENAKQGENAAVWNISKAILRWTVSGHKFLYDPIRQGTHLNHILTETKKEFGIDDDVLNLETEGFYDLSGKALGDLVARGYAIAFNKEVMTDGREEVRAIRTTIEGLAMGEVINDYETGGLRRVKYSIFYIITWWLIVATILKVIASFFGSSTIALLVQALVFGYMTICFFVWFLIDLQS